MKQQVITLIFTNDKIVRPIVCAISVNMMDWVFRRQRFSESLLSD